MTRKDYVALAEALKLAKPRASSAGGSADYAWSMHCWRMAVTGIGNVCAADNPRFDRQRFEKACEGGK